MSTFKPLLAYTVKNPDALRFPVLVSPKLDGIRCVIHNDQPVSRTLKPIPNRFIQSELGFYPPFDGELMVGDPRDPAAFNKSTSGIMSRDGEPDFTYWVFDYVETGFLHMSFETRLLMAQETVKNWPRARLVPHTKVHNAAELMRLEAYYVGLGYEGIMARAPWGTYKFGRSTESQGLLGKVKRFEDTEGTIVGYEELMRNENEATINNLGYQERSTAQAGQIPGGTLGALIVSHPDWEDTFGIGTGFTADERFTLWQIRDTLTG